MFENFIQEHFFDMLNLIVLPLFYWIWESDRRILVLQKDLETYKSITLNYENQFKQLFDKLDEIKGDIHNSFVSQKSCDFRHNKHT